jgi:hypothetical protein
MLDGQLPLMRGPLDIDVGVETWADARARALASTIRKLRKAGFVSVSAITRELNERQVPPAWGSQWHRNTVSRLLERLDRLGRVSRSQPRR